MRKIILFILLITSSVIIAQPKPSTGGTTVIDVVTKSGILSVDYIPIITDTSKLGNSLSYVNADTMNIPYANVKLDYLSPMSGNTVSIGSTVFNRNGDVTVTGGLSVPSGISGGTWVELSDTSRIWLETLRQEDATHDQVLAWDTTAGQYSPKTLSAGGSDDQTIDVFSISGNNIQLSLEDDAEATNTIDVSTTTAVTANTAKVTNATHTGDVTGSGALTIATGAVGADELDEAGVEAGLEAVLDLEDLQGTLLYSQSPQDTLVWQYGEKDTVLVQDGIGWKVPYDITILEVASYTDANTVTFNLEERGETTPNTTGTEVMTSDLVADNNQQETSTFTNASITKDAWLTPVVSATGDVALWGITVRYVKD